MSLQLILIDDHLNNQIQLSAQKRKRQIYFIKLTILKKNNQGQQIIIVMLTEK